MDYRVSMGQIQRLRSRLGLEYPNQILPVDSLSHWDIRMFFRSGKHSFKKQQQQKILCLLKKKCIPKCTEHIVAKISHLVTAREESELTHCRHSLRREVTDYSSQAHSTPQPGFVNKVWFICGTQACPFVYVCYNGIIKIQQTVWLPLHKFLLPGP